MWQKICLEGKADEIRDLVQELVHILDGELRQTWDSPSDPPSPGCTVPR